MRIIRAQTAGFCMGVALALKKLDTALAEQTTRRIVTLGPIIHNPQVLADYAQRGVICFENAEDVLAGDCVVIRAHGIPQREEVLLRTRHAHIVDATCPKVKKAQLAIAHATATGRILLLFGEANHPEVRGLVSYAQQGAVVFDSLDAIKGSQLHEQGHYVLASQTTQDRRLFDEVKAFLSTRYVDMPILYTICDATRERQDEAMDIASHVDIMVVVGGRDSGNTRRLADIAAVKGIPTWHIETVQELYGKKIEKNYSIGLTAGASTPKSLIDAVEIFLG